MKSLLILPLLLCAYFAAFVPPAYAQVGKGEEGEITKSPICSKLTNRSTVNIQGSIMLAPQTLPSGDLQQFSDIFKLAPNGSTQICASGPFYEGRRIDLTIRTLIPLFNCKAALGQEIFLDMKENEDGTKTYSATCR